MSDQNRAVECLTPVGDLLMTLKIKCNLRVTSFHIIKSSIGSVLKEEHIKVVFFDYLAKTQIFLLDLHAKRSYWIRYE